MYLVAMDQQVHSDIAAAAAANHELGPDYSGAVAEGLVERIGSEIDKRVEAKLVATHQGRRGSADLTPTDRRRSLWLGIGIGSAATGITALTASAIIGGSIDSVLQTLRDEVMSNGQNPGVPASYNVAGDMVAGLLGVWALLAVIYIVYSWVRNVRNRE
jgi:hypothetical protein